MITVLVLTNIIRIFLVSAGLLIAVATLLEKALGGELSLKEKKVS